MIVAAADEPSSTAGEGRRGDQRAKSWASRVRSLDPGAATAAFASESIAVVGCPDGEAPSTKTLTDLAAVLGPGGRSYDGVIGVSRVVPDGLDGLPAAYAQAW